ncbi:hypothetical protein BDR05DRAFT_552154 [Suillus weaverae]|nr:hypothetical protein BDR05DRAFT_552154 [Suillus weaverae]
MCDKNHCNSEESQDHCMSRHRFRDMTCLMTWWTILCISKNVNGNLCPLRFEIRLGSLTYYHLLICITLWFHSVNPCPIRLVFPAVIPSTNAPPYCNSRLTRSRLQGWNPPSQITTLEHVKHPVTYQGIKQQAQGTKSSKTLRVGPRC